MALHHHDDVAAHHKTVAPAWRESYYCNFFDHDSDLHGLAWLGVRPNDGRGEVLLGLFDGGETLFRHVDFKVPVGPDVGEERRRLGPLSFEPLEPWSKWQVRFDDGSSSLVVDWEQISAVCDWDWEDVTNSKHYQAYGSVKVSGRVDGRPIEFSGFGERDRAWGERDYGFWTFVWWLIVHFRDGTGAHVFLMRDRDGNDRLHGYLHRDGVSHGLARYEAQVEYTPDGGPPERARHLIVDEVGRELVLREMQRTHYFSFSADGPQVEDRPPEGMERGRMFWTFHRFVRDDGLVGRGMIDYVFWSGNQPAEIKSEGPSYSTIYDYGLTTAAR